MLLQMGRLLHLGPKVITDGTFITLGSIYYTCAFYKGVEGLKPLSQLQTKNETYQWKMINGKKNILKETISFCLLKRIYVNFHLVTYS